MRNLLLLAVVALLTACGTTAYGPYGLNRGYIGGRTSTPGVYQVAGNTTPSTRSGFAVEMAVYRAAELARQDGFRFIQIVFVDNGAMTYGSAAGGMIFTGTSGERAVIRAKGVQSMDAPLACEMGNSAQCRNLDIAELMSQLGPRLGVAPKS